MQDPYFGHRDPFTGVELDVQEAWIDWDYALAAAYQIIQDNTDGNGVLSWENESDNVEVLADRKISKFDASRESKTSGKNYKARPGERYVPNVRLMNGDWPTWSEYVKKFAGEDVDGTIE